jgi:hypothetical protein
MQIENSQKLTFSGHETFPLKYGWLKKVYDIVNYFDDSDARRVFSSEDAIANFGVGKNMVSSMRHWAQAANIIAINDVTKGLELTQFAKDFLDNDGLDPWLEHNATLWLIHWQITKKSSLFTYYWVFNFLNRNEFTREQIATSITNVLENNQHELPSSLTLKRDVECFVRNYTHKSASKSGIFSEDNIESPLAELNLIKRLPHDKFSIQRGYKPHLPSEVFLYALIWFWKEHFASTNTLSLESATYDPESPGRLFFLDEEAVISYAFEAEVLKRVGISWSETAGLRQFITTESLEKVFKKTEEQLQKSYRKER